MDERRGESRTHWRVYPGDAERPGSPPPALACSRMEPMPEPRTRTVTFLLTDVEGSTALWEQDTAAMHQALGQHDAWLADGVAEHGGVVVKSRGEGGSVFAVFDAASKAVGSGVALQLG